MRCDSCRYMNQFEKKKCLHPKHEVCIADCNFYVKKSDKSCWDGMDEKDKKDLIKIFGEEIVEVLKNTDYWLVVEKLNAILVNGPEFSIEFLRSFL